MNLTEREKNLLRLMRNDRVDAIKRKRSWRNSEKAVAIAEVNRLTEKLVSPSVSDVDNDSTVTAGETENPER